jgi:hypothetical protein
MSDENSKFNVLAIGVIGVVAGYLIGKNYGSKISTEVKRVAENPEELKKDLANFRENSGEMLAEVKGKMTNMLGQLEEKLKVVDALLGDKNGEKGNE